MTDSENKIIQQNALQNEGQIGKIVQVTGPVIDIQFQEGALPKIYNAIKINGVAGKGVKINLTAEVVQHVGNNIVRTVAMSSTDGLVRGMTAVDTGAPIKVPVGKGCLGRVFNVLGETVDDDPTPVKADAYWPIHRSAPAFDQQETHANIMAEAVKLGFLAVLE